MSSISNNAPPMDFNPDKMKQKMTERFKASDANEDGSVSKTEAKNALLAEGMEDSKATEMVEQMFKNADTDGDEEISTQEHDDMLASMEERMSQLTQSGYNQGGENLNPMKSLVESILSDMDDDDSDEKDQLTKILEKMESGTFSKEDFSDSIAVLDKVIPSINSKA